MAHRVSKATESGRRGIVLLAAATAALCAGCRPPAPAAAPPWTVPSALSGERAMAEVEALVSLGPRESGTPGAERAAGHIASRLREAGLSPAVDTFTNDTPRGPVAFRNVTAFLPASGAAARERPLILLLSHYDTKSGVATNFAGANDSGSSSGLLIELARVLAATPRRPCDLQFAFLDGEECMREYGPADGLQGSRRLAKRTIGAGEGPRVRAVILLDMVGDRDLMVSIPRNSSPASIAALFRAAERIGTRRHFSLSGGWMTDDHVPFLEAGMPAIDLIDFEYGSAPGRNDYWHTPRDTLDKLSAESLEIVGRTVLAALPAITQSTSP